MTKEELAQFDGQEGRKAFVAVNGRIFDVTESSYWRGGKHLDTHQAGRDLSADILNAPHVRSVIERFPVVAALDETPLEAPTSGGSKAGMIIAAAVAIVVLLWLFLR